MATNDKDRTDEKLHNFIFLNRQNRVGFVDTKIGGDLLVSKNVTTNTLKASKIGYDENNNDASGHAQFLDLSCTSLKINGDTTVSGTITATSIQVESIVKKTMFDIDITDDLDVRQNLDVSGLFTTHGGVDISGNDTSKKINNVDIGYDVSGKGSFTDLSCSSLRAHAIIINTLDNCIIGNSNPKNAVFTDLSLNSITIGDGTLADISSKENHDLLLKTYPSENSIRLNSLSDSNIDINVTGNGIINLNKVNIDAGTIDNTTISSSNITIPSGFSIDVSAGSLILSNDQKLAITKSGFETNNADIDIGDYTLRAQNIIADSIPAGRFVYSDDNGLLSSSASLTYDKINDEITLNKIKGFTLTASTNFASFDTSNIKIISGTIDNTTIQNSDITISSGKTLNLANGNLITSNTKDLAIFKNGVLFNDADVDIGNFTLKSSFLQSRQLTANRIPFISSDGLITDKQGFEYDSSDNRLDVSNISGFSVFGSINLNDNSMINIDMSNGKMNRFDLSDCSLNMTENNFLDVSKATFITSQSQNLAIFKSGASVIDTDLDIGTNNLKAQSITSNSLPISRVVYTGTDGLLTTESNFEYNETSNTLKVGNVDISGILSLASPSLDAEQTGAINISASKIHLITGTQGSFTLPDGSEGQTIIIFFKTKGTVDAEITPTNLWGYTKITLNNIGHSVSLIFTDNKWLILSLFGGSVQ